MPHHKDSPRCFLDRLHNSADSEEYPVSFDSFESLQSAIDSLESLKDCHQDLTLQDLRREIARATVSPT